MCTDPVPLVRFPGLVGAILVTTLALGPAAADDRKPAAPGLDGKWVYESQPIGGWALPRERRDEIWVEIKDGSLFRCGKGGSARNSA